MKINAKGQRYFYALLMITAMVGVAEYLHEKEIIFPEMAALAIGMWIVDKRVWRVSLRQMIFLMTAGAIAGVCIVRYSPFSLLVNFSIAFAFAALCLFFTRTTLIPLISACMLPVLLHTTSWVYPAAVLVMTTLVCGGQLLMEKGHLRKKNIYTPVHKKRSKELLRWLLLLCSVIILAFVPVYTSHLYCILPPLIVTYTEFANSKSGFRNRPVHIFLLLVIAATLGTALQIIGHHYLHWPEAVVALLAITGLFLLYEWSGKYFAPAGAIALIPMIVPQENLWWLPLQVAIGAALFISTAMLLFLKCYKWPKSHLIVCLIPSPLRPGRHRRRH